MILVAGTLPYAAPANRDAAVTASQRWQAEARTEPGCPDDVLAADPVDPLRIVVHELWADDDALATHLVAPAFAAVAQLLADHPSESVQILHYDCNGGRPLF